MRKKTIASRYCRFASKYCRIAGVAPAGSVDTGGEDISGGSGQYNIGILIILALDTTTAAGSTAVVRDGLVLAEQIGNARITHGQRLPADLAHVLDLASMAIKDVEVIAV